MSRRRSLLLTLLVIPLLALAWLTLTESGLRYIYQQAKVYLPGEIHFETLNGKLIGPVSMTALHYQHDGSEVKAQTLILDWQPLALLTTNFNISRLQVTSLHVSLPDTEHSVQAQAQGFVVPDINLPWGLTLKQVEINNLSLTQDKQTSLIKRVRIDASTLFNQLSIKRLDIESDQYALNITGKLFSTPKLSHNLKIGWFYELPDGVTLKGEGNLVGNVNKTQLTQLLQGPLSAKLDLKVHDIDKKLNWETTFDVEHFNSHNLFIDSPDISGKLKLHARGDLDTASATGAIEGYYDKIGAFETEYDLHKNNDDTITINQLTFLATATNTFLSTSGTWKPDSNLGRADLALEWKNLRWPMLEPASFNSASGKGKIEGSAQNYTLALTSDSPWPDLLPSTWQADVDGDSDGIKIKSLHVLTEQGSAIANGRVSWTPALNWQIDVSGSGINPVLFSPQWPGLISARLNSNGRYEDNRLTGETNITQLNGTLRGHPVTLSSRLNWLDEKIHIEQLDFQSGSSVITATGEVNETLNVNWKIDSKNLAELYPQAKGALSADGTISGLRQAPTVQARFTGSDLSLADYQVSRLNGKLNIDTHTWQSLDIELSAQSLQLYNQSLQSLDINTTKKQILANAVSDNFNAAITLTGTANIQGNESGWHGHIDGIDINTKSLNHWQLKKPTALSINANTIVMPSLCVYNQKSNICLQLKDSNGERSAALSATQLPLALIEAWLPADLELLGKTDINATLQQNVSQKITGQARIKLPAGDVRYPLLEGEQEQWQYQDSSINLTIDDSGIRSIANFALVNGDYIRLNFNLPEADIETLNQQQALHAEASMAMHDMSLIQSLLPEIQDLKGVVTLNLTADGTLEKPRLTAKAELIDGALRIPRLGLDINKITLQSESRDNENLSFVLNAFSGDGDLTISGNTKLDSKAGWPTQINIKGDSFKVAHIPEAQVHISPDIQAKIQHRTIDISGNLHVPYAKLQPKDITTAKNVSGDVVIVGGDLPTDEKWQITTRVRLTLGERVTLYGFGFEGRLSGSLLLDDKPGQLTRATGEINIPEGRYRAYGQRLDIEHGRLLFSSSLLSNPGLDLRAVRRTGDVTAGIKVRGNLNQPQLELYSSPAMGQTDILSYLMLGRPIETSSNEEGAMMAKAALALSLSGGDHLARVLGDRFGMDDMRVESSDSGDQASLVVGRYLSPKLYVSYGVGLIESVNTLSLRYKISDKWQLKAESGEHQGADFLYTIER